MVPIEALACGAPVIALGRGGMAETVDDAVGRIYSEPTSAALLAAIDDWESEGCPYRSHRGDWQRRGVVRSRLRDRILRFLAEVVTNGNQLGASGTALESEGVATFDEQP